MPPVVNFNLPPNSQRAQSRKFSRISDGDTPVIEQPVRMVSVDTPEKAQYAGLPATSQPKLDLCRQRLGNGFYGAIPAGLRNYLIARLGQGAAANHIAAGQAATAAFDALLDDRLTKADGSKRSMAVIATGEILDRYGRMLAYLAPWYAGSAADPLPAVGDPARRTFNLDMIENGWGALFPVYGSLPKDADMNLALAAAEAAWLTPSGAWADFGPTFLPGYEFRACIKLGTAATAAEGIANAFQRVCVDLRTLTKVGLFGFDAVPPPYRLWIWQEEEAEATAALGLH